MSTGSVSYAPSATGIRVKSGATYAKGIIKSNTLGYFEIAQINASDVASDAIEQINITNTNSSLGITFYPTFVANAGTGQTMYTDVTTGPLSYMPFTSTLSLTNITASGVITGNGSGVTGIKSISISNVSSNVAYYPTCVAGTGGDKTIYTNSSLSFVPNNGVLTLSGSTASLIVGPTIGTITVGPTMGTINVGTGATGIIKLGGSQGGYITNASGPITISPLNTLNVSGNLMVTGTVTGVTLNASGGIVTAGQVSGATLYASGTVAGVTLNASGGIVTAGAIKGATLYATGQVSGITMNASGGIVTAGTVTGATFIGNGSALTGINMTITSSDSNSDLYPTFVSSVGANQPMYIDSSIGPLKYNPSTSTITLANVTASGTIVATGNVTGASIIGNGALLTDIDNMNINSTDVNSDMYLVLVSSNGANQPMYIDLTGGPLKYNPYASKLYLNEINVKTISGNSNAGYAYDSIKFNSALAYNYGIISSTVGTATSPLVFPIAYPVVFVDNGNVNNYVAIYKQGFNGQIIHVYRRNFLDHTSNANDMVFVWGPTIYLYDSSIDQTEYSVQVIQGNTSTAPISKTASGSCYFSAWSKIELIYSNYNGTNTNNDTGYWTAFVVA